MLLRHCNASYLKMSILQSQQNAGCMMHVCCLYCCTALVLAPAKTSQPLEHLPPSVHSYCAGNLSQTAVVHITSFQTREMWGDKETVKSKLAKRRLEWLGHVARIPDHRMPKSILFWVAAPDTSTWWASQALERPDKKRLEGSQCH